MKNTIDIKKPKLIYRKGVTAVIIDEKYNFLIVHLVKYGKGQWNFVGGGREKVDKTNVDNLFRELKEELGLEKEDFQILEMSKYPDKYDFPEQIINELIEKGKYYKGQKKDVFVVMLTGDKNHIKIDKNKIKKHKWVKFKELKEHLVFEGQYEHFLKVIKETIPQAINPEEKNNK